MKSMLIAVVLAASCRTSMAPPLDSMPVLATHTEAAVPCEDGPDATARVQAAMTAAQCLPPGIYSIDTPALGVTGRRRDAMLTGGTLCGVRDALTVVRFRGDAHQLFWVGVMNANVRDLRLESGCLTNTYEQTHLIRATIGVTISNVTLAHPTRTTSAGDNVNVVGNATAPVVGFAIDHAVLESCARFGVQMSAFAQAPQITNNLFGEGCGIGSEGSGGLVDVAIANNTFTGTTRSIGLNLQRMTRLVFSHNQVHGHGVFVFTCDDCRIEHNVVDALGPWLAGDFMPAIHIADAAHRLVVTDNQIDQTGMPSVSAILIGPLRTNHQADLGDLEVSDNTVRQATIASFISATGVAGLHVLRNRLSYTGLVAPVTLVAGPSIATAPAISVPSTDIQEAYNVIYAAN